MDRLLGLLLFTLACTIFGGTKIVQPKPYCEVSEQAAHFNFTPLAQEFVIDNSQNGEVVRLKLCEPLTKPCNDMQHYSICLTRDNEEIGIGQAPPASVSADSGQLRFKFTGETCEGAKNYSVHIIMRCDNEAGYIEGPYLLPHDTDKCTYYMVWMTKAACDPEHTVECTAVDENQHHYDLSPLTLRSENYIVPVANRTDMTMILNVCHSVVYDYNVTCPPRSGVCFRMSGMPGKPHYRGLGYVAKPPYFEDGELKLKYEGGEICTGPGNKSEVDTVITFECEPSALSSESGPIYYGEARDCRHQFYWRTPAACSIESLKNRSLRSSGTCKVTNPLKNIEYNLRELMFKEFGIKVNDTLYTFEVCGPLLGSTCSDDTGACDEKNHMSMGKANSKLLWNRGGPYLNYTDGAECGNNRRHYTQIGFFCGLPKIPVLMEKDDCSMIIHWELPFVCDEHLTCQTESGVMNLTLLMRSDENYVVNVNDTEYHINVCRPLVPKPYLTCLHGSAACQVIPQGNGQFINEVSLGYSENPFINEKEEAKLRYTGGSPCPEDKNVKLSTNTTFVCNHTAETGAPIFKHYKNCTYVFEWQTSVVCETIKGLWKPGCIIENPRLSKDIDLNPLRKVGVSQIPNWVGHWFNVSLCGGMDLLCNGSAVCKDRENYGNDASVFFDYSKDAILLKYEGGNYCLTGPERDIPRGFLSSEVRLVCNESAGVGRPRMLEHWESESSLCHKVIEWKTAVACLNRDPSIPIIDYDAEIPNRERWDIFISCAIFSMAMGTVVVCYGTIRRDRVAGYNHPRTIPRRAYRAVVFRAAAPGANEEAIAEIQ